MGGKKNIKCLITAGATREYFDPVRYVSNPSTGKMGVAIARAAQKAGWQTTLALCESSALSSPDGVRTLRADTGDELLALCCREFSECDILIMSAAVCDFRPKRKFSHKIKKGEMEMSVEFERTEDILKTLSSEKRDGQILVGFAAETNDVISYAKKKFVEKNLNCVVANKVGVPNGGFASDTNTVSLILRGGKVIDLPSDSKENVASAIVDFLEKNFFSSGK